MLLIIFVDILIFNIFGKFSFLNRISGLRKSFLNQTTYVLKNRLYQQSFLNQDSFLNQAFLNRDSTVPVEVLVANGDFLTDNPLEILCTSAILKL
jgi:hypothetical protein